MGRIGVTVIAVLALAAAAPEQMAAQNAPWEQGRQRDRDYERDRGNGTIWDVIVGRDRNARANQRGGGPPFCRNGQGHPVHGRQWCRDKGFGAGGGLGNIIFHDPRREGRLSEGGLIGVLGDVVFGRVQERSRMLGSRQPLYGTWHSAPGGGKVLAIRAGEMLIAELTDDTRDGRVDQFRLRRQR